MSRTSKIVLTLVTALLLVFSVACTPSEAKLIEGILQDVDAVNGEATIVTKDGKTVTVTIATDAQVETENASSSLETLEPGVSVEVEVNDEGQVAHHIKARQAEAEGTIVGIEGNDVTIESEDGHRVIVLVNEQTRIELGEGFPGTLADLQIGVGIAAKFDPESRVAFKIEVAEEEREVEEAKEEEERAGWGTIEIRVTDPPPADVKSAVVYLANIEIHRVSRNESESDNTSGWITVSGAPPSFDLMDVIGVEEVLGSANITAGKFTQIRMDVTKVEGETTDNVSYTAEVPSNKLKIARPFNVGAGTTTVLTLDFDGEKSLIRTGNGKFLFKPVVKLLIEKKQGHRQEQGQEQRQGQRQKTEKLEFKGIIDAIDGNIWTMTIDGESRTVDVSGAEIEGEPEAGLQARVEGMVVAGTIIASGVEIQEAEERESE